MGIGDLIILILDIVSKEEERPKQQRKRKESKAKVPTTRNLILTGHIKWDRMREADIRREIEFAFGSSASVQFWKYFVEICGISYTKHLNWISVSFETSRECRDNLRRFVLGMTDLASIGQAITLSMDQHKKRANEYYERHIRRQQSLQKSIFGKR